LPREFPPLSEKDSRSNRPGRDLVEKPPSFQRGPSPPPAGCHPTTPSLSRETGLRSVAGPSQGPAGDILCVGCETCQRLKGRLQDLLRNINNAARSDRMLEDGTAGYLTPAAARPSPCEERGCGRRGVMGGCWGGCLWVWRRTLTLLLKMGLGGLSMSRDETRSAAAVRPDQVCGR